jgi:hypothetical protein
LPKPERPEDLMSHPAVTYEREMVPALFGP